MALVSAIGLLRSPRRFAWCAVALLALSLFSGPVSAQIVLMMPDSTNNRLATFDPFNGALINSNLFGLAGGTPIHAMQVNNEIWVSEQLGDRISRWTFAGVPAGQLGTAGLDNVRGMELNGNTVYVASTGTGNGAPGRSVHMYDTAGNDLGFFSTPLSASFGILNHQGSLLVSSDSANDDIHRYSLTGTSMGVFHNSTSLNFAEQMDIALNGDILVAAFSSNIIARLDPVSGAILSTFAASGARGVHQLGNGNIMWTNSAGAHVFDVGTGTSSLVYSGGGRFIDTLVIPEPASLSLLLGLALLAIRRRDR